MCVCALYLCVCASVCAARVHNVHACVHTVCKCVCALYMPVCTYVWTSVYVQCCAYAYMYVRMCICLCVIVHVYSPVSRCWGGQTAWTSPWVQCAGNWPSACWRPGSSATSASLRGSNPLGRWEGGRAGQEGGLVQSERGAGPVREGGWSSQRVGAWPVISASGHFSMVVLLARSTTKEVEFMCRPWPIPDSVPHGCRLLKQKHCAAPLKVWGELMQTGGTDCFSLKKINA